MNTERNDKGTNTNPKEDNAAKPDPGTLHNTDPQENMQGPISSLLHDTGEQFTPDETKRDADEEKERNM